jgi:thioester reductase-like protein
MPKQEKKSKTTPKKTKKKKAAPKKAAPARHFLTGYPGFIGRRLVEALARQDDKAQFTLLVQSHMMEAARAMLGEMALRIGDIEKRCDLVVGDITHQTLGITGERLEELRSNITIVWHLAAIYDLATKEEIAYRINVNGTAHILDFCESVESLERLNYISTCYVAGDRTGLVLETDLQAGQGFHNHYESTKYWAEVEVQRRWDRIPTTIFRPGVVIGDSRTGETDKYDGPYFLIKLLASTPSWIPMVHFGRGDALANMVPVDYTVDAILAIAKQKSAEHQVFQLADPNSMTAHDLIDLMLRVFGRRPAIGTVPYQLLTGLLSWERARQLIGMPREVVIYFNHEVRFDVTNTLDALHDTEVRCPHVSTYIRTLVDYVRRNPKKKFLDRRTL